MTFNSQIVFFLFILVPIENASIPYIFSRCKTQKETFYVLVFLSSSSCQLCSYGQSIMKLPFSFWKIISGLALLMQRKKAIGNGWLQTHLSLTKAGIRVTVVTRMSPMERGAKMMQFYTSPNGTILMVNQRDSDLYVKVSCP